MADANGTVSATITPFGNAHHAAALTLWQRTPGVGLSSSDDADAIAKFLRRNPGTSFVALRGIDMVGTVLCGHDGRRGLIHHLVVAEECRRQGMGRQLLAAGLTALRSQGITKAHLLVFRSNEPGLAFWRQVGASERVELGLFSIATDHDV